MCIINKNHIICSSWNIRCDGQKYLSFWAVFCLFSRLTMEKIKILKLKNTSGDVIILHICTTNDNHMMHGSWDMERNRQTLSFWTVFYPFPSLWTQKINILKKWKQTWRYYHFINVYRKWQSYNVWFLRYEVQLTKLFVILDCSLPFYPPNNPKDQSFVKMKKHLEILSFDPCVP